MPSFQYELSYRYMYRKINFFRNNRRSLQAPQKKIRIIYFLTLYLIFVIMKVKTWVLKRTHHLNDLYRKYGMLKHIVILNPCM